jgi:hypothetical protein
MMGALKNNTFAGFPLGTPKQKSKEGSDSVKVFTKEQYTSTVKKKRREFVHAHFETVLNLLYDSLREDANKIKPCRREAVFDSIPSEFEMDKLEGVLCAYFTDMGYKPIEARRDPGNARRIVIILT